MSTAIPKQSSIYRSLVWKETRQLKEFFIAMVGLAAFLQILMTVWIKAAGSTWPQAANFYVYAVAGGFIALFAAACGATLYATEKEERTFANLQLLPLRSHQLAVGKLSGALAMCVVFLLAAMVVAYGSILLWGGRPVDLNAGTSSSTGWLTMFVGVFGLAAIEFFAWSWLFSLLSSKPLSAALLGIFFASAGIQIAVFLTGEPHIDYASIEPYANAWAWRATIAAIVLLIGASLANGWLSSTNQNSQVTTTSKRKKIARALNSPFFLFGKCVPRKNGPLIRLTWQSMRESWWPVLIAFISPLAFGILLTIANPALGVWTFPILVTAGGFAGLAAFSADQKREGQQFLATHGVSPTRVWFARSIPWMLAICLAYLALYLIIILVMTMSGQIQTTPQSLVIGFFTGFNEGPMLFEFFTRGIMFTFGILAGFFVAGTMLCFSAGQFVSLTIRSRILAAVVTLIVCLPLVYWLILMIVGGVPIWWSVLPIAVAFLLAGWQSLRGLLSAKSVAARVTIPAAIILLTTAVVVFGVVRHRATEIPKIAVMFDRVDNSDPAIIDEIREKFRAPLAAIERPEKLPGVISGYYPAILKTNKHFDSQGNFIPLDDPEAEDWENWNLAEIKQNLFYNYLDDYYRDSWKEGGRFNQLPDIDQLTKLSAEFLSQNQKNLEQIRESVDFAWKHQDQLEQQEPWNRYRGGEPAIPRSFASFWELMDMDFYHAMDIGDPERAWANLKAMSQFLKLATIQTPDREHWYSQLFDLYESWTLCENQTPELLNEAIRFVMKKFLPIDRQRMLEYQYIVMRDEIETGQRTWIESPFDNRISDSAMRFLQRLPCERERARRLIDLWCAMKLDQVKRMGPPLEMRSRIDHAMAWFWGNPASIDRILAWQIRVGAVKRYLKTTEKIKNLPHPEWLNELKKSDCRFWAQTTIFPSPNDDFGYFEDLTRLDYETRRPEIDIALLYRERKELLLFQMWVVKYKLENNEFPENLDRLGFLTTEKLAVPGKNDFTTRYFSTNRYVYYPLGLPNVTKIATSNNDNEVPANTPFIANRQAVPFARQEWLMGPIMKSYWHLLPAHTGFQQNKSTYEPGPMFVLLAKPPESAVEVESVIQEDE